MKTPRSQAGSTGLLAAVESPLGITRAVKSPSERLIGIALGAEEDYVRNLRTERSQAPGFAVRPLRRRPRVSAGGTGPLIPSPDANNEAGFLQRSRPWLDWALTVGADQPRQIELLHNSMRRRVKRSPMRVSGR